MSVQINLPPKAADFIRLVLRSPDTGDGWRKISKILEPLAIEMADYYFDLFDLDNSMPMHVRLTDHGKTLGQYL